MSQTVAQSKEPVSQQSGRKATPKQIERVLDLLRGFWRKYSFDDLQAIITNGGAFLTALSSTIDNFLVLVRNLVVVTVSRVDRTRTPPEVLADLGRVQYVNHDVVATMLGHGEGIDQNSELTFFKVGRYLNNANEVMAEYDLRGFKPADAYLVSGYNREKPDFADDKPNATIWQDKDGNWCYFACYRLGVECGVDVGRDDYVWFDSWWFAGVRK